MNNLIILSTICFVAMLSPGPDFVLVTRNSLKYPKRQAFATAFGIISGCLIHATYCILGLAFIITKSVLLFSFIKYAGAIYLIYIGLKSLTSKPVNQEKKIYNVHLPQLTTSAAFMQGFFCNLLNPKLAVFLLSLFTQFISVDATIMQKASVAGVFVLESALYWPLVVLILQSKAVRVVFDRFQIFLDRFCGALLIGLGIKVALTRD
jgi:RhtB (resistance to homoserine/threonine) family protein